MNCASSKDWDFYRQDHAQNIQEELLKADSIIVEWLKQEGEPTEELLRSIAVTHVVLIEAPKDFKPYFPIPPPESYFFLANVYDKLGLWEISVYLNDLADPEIPGQPNMPRSFDEPLPSELASIYWNTFGDFHSQLWNIALNRGWSNYGMRTMKSFGHALRRENVKAEERKYESYKRTETQKQQRKIKVEIQKQHWEERWKAWIKPFRIHFKKPFEESTKTPSGADVRLAVDRINSAPEYEKHPDRGVRNFEFLVNWGGETIKPPEDLDSRIKFSAGWLVDPIFDQTYGEIAIEAHIKKLWGPTAQVGLKPSSETEGTQREVDESALIFIASSWFSYVLYKPGMKDIIKTLKKNGRTEIQALAKIFSDGYCSFVQEVTEVATYLKIDYLLFEPMWTTWDPGKFQKEKLKNRHRHYFFLSMGTIKIFYNENTAIAVEKLIESSLHLLQENGEEWRVKVQ